MKIDKEKLNTLLEKVFSVEENDIGCGACGKEMDAFVDLHIAGKDAAASLPLVRAHLDQCRDCREEFEALLAILENYPHEAKP